MHSRATILLCLCVVQLCGCSQDTKPAANAPAANTPAAAGPPARSNPAYEDSAVQAAWLEAIEKEVLKGLPGAKKTGPGTMAVAHYEPSARGACVVVEDKSKTPSTVVVAADLQGETATAASWEVVAFTMAVGDGPTMQTPDSIKTSTSAGCKPSAVLDSFLAKSGRSRKKSPLEGLMF